MKVYVVRDTADLGARPNTAIGNGGKEFAYVDRCATIGRAIQLESHPVNRGKYLSTKAVEFVAEEMLLVK